MNKNANILKYVFLFFSLLVFAQLFRIQVLEASKWQTRSEIKNALRTTYQAVRGSVYFVDGSPLAVSELAYTIYGLPQAFNQNVNYNKEEFAKYFSEIIGIREEFILESLNSDKKYIALARKVLPEKLKKLESKYPQSLGLWNAEQQFIRNYPNGSLASKIIGFVRIGDNGEEIGQYGIEQEFNGVLRGTEGVFSGVKDNINQVIVNQDFQNIASRDGISLTITVDRGIQAILEEKLMKWLDITKSKEVSAIIMEANTGRIIAMGNVPHYNPNVYWEGEIIDCSLSYYFVLHKKCNPDIEEEKEEEILTEDQLIYPDGYIQQLERIKEEEKRLKEEKRRLEELLNEGKEEEYTQEELKRLNQYPENVRDVFRRESLPYADVYRNSASSSLYEPGSVVKVLTLAIAYNFDAIPTDPEYQLGSHQGCEQVIDVRLCTSNRRPRASLNVEEMLRYSDNIGAFRVAQKIPAKDFAETLQRFGLGQKSNIELADEPFFSMKPPAQWTKVDLSTGAFGQGSVAFTPVQLTAAWNALASNGYYYRPTIIDSREDNGQIMKFAKKPIRQAVKPEAAKKALEVNGIATRNSSTRARQFYDKYTFSGKTATANITKPDGIGYLPNAVNMGYIGVAPLDNPKFTMLVWFNEPKLGENGVNPDSISVAQYAWLDIANDLMIKLNIPPKRL